MLGKTHVAVGIAASLIILQPSTEIAMATAIVGSSVGSWISDIDCKDISKEEGAAGGFIATVSVVGVVFLIDYLLKGNISSFLNINWESTIAAFSVVLIAIGIFWGLISPHRTFMHSIFSAVVFTVLIYQISTVVALPFFIGYLSHLIIDLPNMRKMQLFYPIQARVGFGWCSSNGRANDVLMRSAFVIDAILIGVYFYRGFSQLDFSNINVESKLPLFGKLQLYLIIINIVSFFVLCIDHYICTHSDIISDQNGIHTVEDLLGLFGGGVGMLLAFIFLKEWIGKHNANWYVIVISEILLWVILYLIITDYINSGGFIFDTSKHKYAMILVKIYYPIINIIAFICFFKDRNRFRPSWSGFELFLLLLGIAGGALGGYLTIILTGKKSNSPHFGTGLPVLIFLHAVIIAYLVDVPAIEFIIFNT